LETGHQALFQARPFFAGPDVAVYVAMSHLDFQSRLAGSASGVYAATGAAMSIASGRISYVLCLQGPCMSIDTACSSSLAALHMSCSSTPMLTLVASANAMLAPAVPLAYARAGMLSANGRCRTFDAHANGYVRSEGCAAVALAPGAPAWASLCATAVRQDGRSASLTAPNASAQRLLLLSTLSAAGLRAGDLAMLEAHGTGTALGDPTEVSAGCDAIGAGFFWSSSKASLGHTEPTAGMAGLAKLAVACEQRSDLGNALLRTLNTHIRDLMGSAALAAFSTQRAVIGGPATARGGLSSFGKLPALNKPPRHSPQCATIPILILRMQASAGRLLTLSSLSTVKLDRWTSAHILHDSCSRGAGTSGSGVACRTLLPRAGRLSMADRSRDSGQIRHMCVRS
jgi:acyl transferase domain-containing protein